MFLKLHSTPFYILKEMFPERHEYVKIMLQNLSYCIFFIIFVDKCIITTR
jgi:hypothetical protein